MPRTLAYVACSRLELTRTSVCRRTWHPAREQRSAWLQVALGSLTRCYTLTLGVAKSTFSAVAVPVVRPG